MQTALEIAIDALQAIFEEMKAHFAGTSHRSPGELLQVVAAIAEHELESTTFAMKDGPHVPWEVIKAMTQLDIEDHHDDNGPGRIVCAGCGCEAPMIWKNGERQDEKELKHLVHTNACPRQFAFMLIKFAP